MSTTELTPADEQAWRELWDELYRVHYNAHFDQLCAEHSVKFWRRVDTVARAAELLTTSTSAIAGWAIWTQGNFSMAWNFLLGAAALLALGRNIFNYSEKIKQDTLVYSEFKKVRLELEQLRSKMKLGALEKFSDYKKEYLEILQRLASANALTSPDYLMRAKTQKKIQQQLNSAIGYDQAIQTYSNTAKPANPASTLNPDPKH